MFDPEFPCREMPTRACPGSYDGLCGDRPCARYEFTGTDAQAEQIWSDELASDFVRRLRQRQAGMPIE